MAISAGKFILDTMDLKMFFIAHIHQPIIASPIVREDDAVEGYLSPDRSL